VKRLGMPSTRRNSMAEIMTVLVTVAMWIVGAMGVIGIPLFSVGLSASLSGGDSKFPLVRTLVVIVGLAVIVPGVIYICFQLRHILLTLAEGDPFVPENARRLTRIGTAIAAMELIRIATVMVVRAVPSFVGDKLPPISTQFILWISVAALFVLSQVFREGTRLRDEEKMTI
jgi:hypothetical protein